MIDRLRGFFSPWRPPERWRDRDLERPVAEVFLAVAERYPDRPAVDCNGRQLSYHQLRRQSMALGVELGKAPPSGIVGIYCQQNESAVVAILGILLAGRTPVFLSPEDSAERRNRIAEISGIQILVTETVADLEAALPGGNVTGIALKALDDSPEYCRSPRRAVASDLALVFTSGQTGKPSGVRYSQRNQLHTVRHLARRCGITHADRIALMVAPSFGAAWNDLFLALLSGACICPVSPTKAGRGSLAKWLVANSISYCHSVPSVFRTIAREDPAELERLGALRWFRLGGEPFRKSDFELFRERFPASVRVLLSFGATETGGVIADWELSASSGPPPFDEERGNVITIGRGIPGKEVLILDPAGDPVTGGGTGEIAVRSRYLAAGYFQDDEKTAERFRNTVPPGKERLFFTRDLGRIDSAGLIWHLGRSDGQLKWRGVRFDPAEIESPLRLHPAVEDAAVALVEGDSPLLAACLVPKAGNTAPTLPELKAHLAALIPHRLLPNLAVSLEALPRRSNGKVDRDQLAALARAMRVTECSVPPRSELEDIVTGIWRRLLNNSDLSIYDDFFEWGGDSLTAVTFQSELTARLGIEMPVATLFGEHPTVAHVVEQIRHCYQIWASATKKVAELETPFPALVPIRRGGGGRPIVFLPGGYGSEAELMLFVRLIRHLNPSSPIYGIRATTLYQMTPPPGTLGEVADLYLSELEEALTGEDLILVGNCVAGLVAFEMACRLERPHSLILIESRSRFRWRNQDQADGAGLPPFAKCYYDLLAGYTPGRYAGNLHLVVSEAFHDPAEPTLGWHRHTAGAVAVTRVPGDHHDAIRKQSDHLGRELARIIGELSDQRG